LRLSLQTRVDIAHRAEEYISDLVGNYNGDHDDVISIIEDLHQQTTLGGSEHTSERSGRGASDIAPSPFRWQGEVSSP
jgi:hypothetical protein